jgi:serine/threonine-protein kinase
MSGPKPEAIARTVGDPGATVVPGGATDVDRTVVTELPPASAEVAATVPPEPGEAGPKKISRVGDFQLVKKLGQGGMGTVFLAKQVSLDRLVALKTLSKELAKREDFVARFLREARAMARLDHPNVVRVYAAESSQGLNYAAIEYIDGQSMQRWMDQLGQLSVGDALCVTLAAADALRHAHEQNMIHRDVKPDNILVTKRGVVKVADFGLAKAVDEDVSMTQSGTGLGTPLYMAPEQGRNAKHVDVRTDVYALGCTLYYFLTGKLPFMGKDAVEIILAKEQGKFANARKLNPEVPERLDLMIDKMIAKDPHHRYASCAELIKDLSSLRLANASLSFIDDALPTLPGATAAPTAPGKPRPKTATTAIPKPATTAAKSAGADQRWSVLHTAANGQATVSRMTTEQIQKGLKGGLFDQRTTRVKRTEAEEFLPLAQFAEFEATANALASRGAAEKRVKSLRGDFAKFEKEDRWRRRLKPIKNFFKGLGGLASLILWLALVGGVIWAAWYWGWPLLRPYVSSEPTTEAPAEP